ncbi:MAG: TRAP transporter large permease [Inquilinaceae bacterium]
MSPMLLLFGGFGLLLLIGTPIVVALGASAMLVYIAAGNDFSSLIVLAYNAVDSFPIMALPAFILSGALMGDAGISRRLIAVAEAMAGSAAGGLGAAAIVACLFFGAVSGSGPATTAAISMLLIPAMVERGYASSYAAAVTASAGGLGIIIPPSIPMVIYGVTASESISELFLAGVLPGVLLSGSLLLVNYIRCRRLGYVGEPPVASGPSKLKVVRDAFWSLMAPVVILGGIYSGMFTPTEAAVVAVFYSLFVGVFIHRESTWDGIRRALESTTWLTGRVLIIMFAATAFGRVLVENQIPTIIANHIIQLTDSLTLIWLVVIAFLLVLGMFLETLAMILIVTPVLLPVMVAFGVDPVHFGVVLVVCCLIGFSTPPLGENMFIASSIANVSIEAISVKALPCVAVMVATVIVLAMFPQISLFLPRLAGF